MRVTLNTARQVFEEQIAAFAQRLELVGTQRFDDLRAEEHYRAFAVAGAMKADLLADLHAAVGKAAHAHDLHRQHQQILFGRSLRPAHRPGNAGRATVVALGS